MEKIKKSEQFNLLYKKGEKIYTKYTIIFNIKGNKQNFGFVASKKVGNAVKRNRYRRLFKEVVYKNSQFFDKQTSYVIVARKTCLEDFNILKYEIIKNDILRGIKRNEKNIDKNNRNISKNT